MGVHIVYETHSVTEDNEQGIATGWLPGRLSERGRHLARELGARRRSDNIASVFTSDLRRAVDTAAIAFEDTSLRIVQDARLRECNYGRWNGMPVAQLRAEQMRHIDVPFPDGESYRQVITRVASFLTDLARDWEGARVLLIGHAATRFSLDHLLKCVSLDQLLSAPFAWHAGWDYSLPSGWSHAPHESSRR